MSEITSTPDVTPTEGTPQVEASTGTEQPNENSFEKKPDAEKPVAQKKKYKIKVDGQEIDEEFDPNDDEAVKNQLQLARAAKKRIAEAAADKKKAKEIIAALESDPENLLRRMGPKGREIAEKFLLSQIEEEMLTPEQRELKQLKQENETFKQKEQRLKEEAEARAAAEKENQIAADFQKTIITAIEKSGLKKSPVLVKRMAQLMAKNLEYGLELTPDDLVAEVKGDVTSDLKSIVSELDGDQLIELFGAEIANKIRKSDLKKLQEKQSHLFQPKKSESAPSPELPQRGWETTDEWKARVRRNAQN